jgi:hypothetical protein
LSNEKKQITIRLNEDALNAIIKLSRDLNKTVDELLEESIGYLIKKYKTAPRKIENIIKKCEKKPHKKDLF